MVGQLSATQLESLIQASPLGMMLLNNSGQAIWMNDLLKDILGEQADSILNHSVDEVPETLQSMYAENATVYLDNDEETLCLLTTTRPVEGGEGVMQFFIDATSIRLIMEERDQLRRELEEYRLIDKESGMPNHRALFQSLEPQVARSRRYQNPLSVIIMQINNLDAYIAQNPKTSPAALFTSLRYLLNDQLRWADIIGRLDKNEILMVLPETNEEDAHKLVDKVNQRLSILDIPELTDASFHLSTSYGIAEWHKGDDVGLLMMRAREQLNDQTEAVPA
ncbi:MAG: GGDEF domain-containing protein [Gammaproteobacteria bacterium]|nr:GGDEF domain-containing protein [Gammaproteobacteria bacterium]